MPNSGRRGGRPCDGINSPSNSHSEIEAESLFKLLHQFISKQSRVGVEGHLRSSN